MGFEIFEEPRDDLKPWLRIQSIRLPLHNHVRASSLHRRSSNYELRIRSRDRAMPGLNLMWIGIDRFFVYRLCTLRTFHARVFSRPRQQLHRLRSGPQTTAVDEDRLYY